MKSRRGVLASFIAFGVSAVFSKKSEASFETRKASELSNEEIAAAWDDPVSRNRLSEEQWAALPSNPAGKIKSGEFGGNIEMASGNNCSGNNCSGNNCSGNNCSGNNCSGNNCSGNACSGNNCSGNNCSGNNCSGNNCSAGYYC